MAIDGIVETQQKHIDWLAGRLRQEHVREVEGLVARSAADQLRESFALSHLCLCGIRNSRPVFVMGILPASAIGGFARVWMLGTDEISLYPRWVVTSAERGARVGFARTGADAMGAWVPSWYRTGLRFLKGLRFAPFMETPMGVCGEKHVLMVRRAPAVNC